MSSLAAPTARSVTMVPLVPVADRGSDPEEHRLAERLRAGDPDALRDAYDRYGRATFGLLLRTLGDRALAEDVQQQVFLEVWQRASSYDPARAGLLTWIMMIARSRAVDQLRRRIPEPRDPTGETGVLAAADVSVEAEVDALADRWHIAALLRRLPEPEADVLRQRFYGGSLAERDRRARRHRARHRQVADDQRPAPPAHDARRGGTAVNADDAVSYLIGELDADQRRAFEEAMAADAAMRAEVERLQPAVDALESLPPEAWEMPEPPPLRIAALPSRAPAEPPATEPDDRPSPPPIPLRRSRRIELRPALAALGRGRTAHRRRRHRRARRARHRRRRHDDPGHHGRGAARCSPSAPADPNASGRVSIAQAGAGKRSVKLHVDGLPRTGRDAFYELWLLGDDGQLVALGTFRVDEAGNATVQVPLAVDPSNFRYFDISRQPNNGNPKHSGDSVLRGETRS